MRLHITAYLSVICLLLPVFLKAQDNKLTKRETFTIKLQKFPIANFPENAIPVSDIRLIQVLPDSINLGYTTKGMMVQHVVVLRPSKPLTDFLQEHIMRMYKSSYAKNGAKMLWILKDLRFGEKLIPGQVYGYNRMVADSYISNDGKLYKKLFSLDTVFVVESADMVTTSYATNIETALKYLSKRSFLSAENVFNTASEERTVEQIMDQAKQNYDHRILSDTVYNEGAYASFQEFLDNKPTVLNIETVLNGDKITKFTRKGTDGQPETISIWGLCQKGELFKYDNEKLVPLERQDNGFVISAYVDNTNKMYRKASGRSMPYTFMIGGVTGGLLGAMAYRDVLKAEKDKYILVRSYPYITEPDEQPIATCINMRTGEWSF